MSTTCTRECPRCGSAIVCTLEDGYRTMVECPTCSLRFEVSPITPKIRRGKVGAPSSASYIFKYVRAGGGVVEFARRMRRYARA